MPTSSFVSDAPRFSKTGRHYSGRQFTPGMNAARERDLQMRAADRAQNMSEPKRHRFASDNHAQTVAAIQQQNKNVNMALMIFIVSVLILYLARILAETNIYSNAKPTLKP